MGILDNLWKKPTEDADEKITKRPINPSLTAQKTTPASEIKSNQWIDPLSTPQGNHTQALTGTKKPQIVEFFKKVFEESNIPGPDYFEFVSALDTMKDQPLDEKTKYVTIFASFKAMGVTPQKLMETAGKYKALFTEKKNSFDKEADNRFEVNVNQRKEKIQKLTEESIEIDRQVADLIAKKNANKADVEILNEEIQTESNSIAVSRADFQATYDAMVAEIDHNVKLFQDYLPTV